MINIRSVQSARQEIKIIHEYTPSLCELSTGGITNVFHIDDVIFHPSAGNQN